MKALALISGGLDSILAARLIKDQGIQVIGLHFIIPFCKNGLSDKAKEAGIDSQEIVLGQEYLEIIKNPRHGFGSCINPCIDCKILMLRKAKALLEEYKAGFVITGEVLGQRPMSQNREALDLIERRSGLEGLLLRPLCAKLLPETIAEQKGWVDRNKLMDFNGRGRNSQMSLARAMGMHSYQQPAGGCVLTDPAFSRRVKDLIEHNALNMHDVELLKLGRHFRIASRTKLVVGRDQRESELLVSLAKDRDYLFYPDEHTAGPTALGRGEFDEEAVKLSSRVVLGYCDIDKEKEGTIIYRKVISGSATEHNIRIIPMNIGEIASLRL